MTLISHEALDQVIANYGYVAIGIVVGLESIGIPLPGETTLVLAAMYAARNPDLNIWMVAASGAAGAIIGDNAGYWIGRRFGYPLLRRFGYRLGMSDRRIKVGRYLFARFGLWVVFLGRFVALLRVLAAFLAGVNHMKWPLFLPANAAGGVLWAAIFSLGPYYLGKAVLDVHDTLGPIILAGAAFVLIALGFLIRHQEDRLYEKAERAFPGPLQ
jgi:membrane protein DedA with SNARE-associated domain